KHPKIGRVNFRVFDLMNGLVFMVIQSLQPPSHSCKKGDFPGMNRKIRMIPSFAACGCIPGDNGLMKMIRGNWLQYACKDGESMQNAHQRLSGMNANPVEW